MVKQLKTLLQPVNFRIQILDHGRFHHLLVNLNENETIFNVQLVTSEKKFVPFGIEIEQMLAELHSDTIFP